MMNRSRTREKSGALKAGAGRNGQRGSVLVMSTVLSFAMFVLGLVYLTAVGRLALEVSGQLSKSQSYYAAYAGLAEGDVLVKSRRVGYEYNGGWVNWYGFTGYRTRIDPGGWDVDQYGYSQGFDIIGEGASAFFGSDGDYPSSLTKSYDLSTFADYLYLSNKERDPVRDSIVRFWTPDTLDGKVHSNDTLHIQGSPRFIKKVTSFAGVTDPPNSNADFDEGFDWAREIHFPDQADEIRQYNGYPGWGTSTPDSATEITFSGPYIYRRYCGYDVDSVFRCYPENIADAFMSVLPATGALFIQGKLIIKADRNGPDIMDPNFRSLGFEGRLTVASSDTMIIPDNLIYRFSKPDNSVPDTIRDVLGLISENYIMFGEDSADTLFVNAALAAIRGSITVQDIYDEGKYNEKQSLFIYGCLAQRNRGLVHSSFNGGVRGFIEKDYHYDSRLQMHPPPHYLPTDSNNEVYQEDFYDEG